MQNDKVVKPLVNLLIDPLPQSVAVGGADWPVNSAFFIMVQFELLMQDGEIPEEEKVCRALALFYPHIPPDVAGAVRALLWFYRCGREEGAAQGGPSGDGAPRAYCFQEDAGRIYAAFYAHYHMDLNTAEDLHWWKFRALFQGLPEDCELSKIMGYRTADLTGLSKEQKKFYTKMRARYALGQSAGAAEMTQAEREKRMLEYAARRSREAGHP